MIIHWALRNRAIALLLLSSVVVAWINSHYGHYVASETLQGFVYGICILGPVVSAILWSCKTTQIGLLKELNALQRNIKVVGELRDESVKAMISQAVQQERVKIADKLHDQTLGSISCIHLQIDALSETLQNGRSGQFDIGKSRDLVKHTYEELRDVVTSLKHNKLNEDAIDFLHDLEQLLLMVLKPLGIDCEFKIGQMQGLENFNFEIQMELYRILKECINNIVKHANASQVCVEIEMVDNKICCRVCDNGSGFDPKKSVNKGLLRIEQRIISYMGKFMVDSGPAGTTIQFSIPKTSLKYDKHNYSG